MALIRWTSSSAGWTRCAAATSTRSSAGSIRTYPGGLAEIGGVDLRGQLYNVFRVGCGRIVAVEDYAHREEALAAAGAKAPQWA